MLFRSSDIAALPTVQFSLTWLNDQGNESELLVPSWVPLTGCLPEHGVLFVKYCSILLQALTIQADEDFLYAVYELSKIRGASWEKEQTQYVLTLFDLSNLPHFCQHSHRATRRHTGTG